MTRKSTKLHLYHGRNTLLKSKCQWFVNEQPMLMVYGTLASINNIIMHFQLNT